MRQSGGSAGTDVVGRPDVVVVPRVVVALLGVSVVVVMTDVNAGCGSVWRIEGGGGIGARGGGVGGGGVGGVGGGAVGSSGGGVVSS